MEDFIVELTSEEREIKNLIEPLLDSEGYELVNLRLGVRDYSTILSLYVDKAAENEKILMENLKDISHLVGDVLDMNTSNISILNNKYELEVSSPGLDRPLTKASHFKNCIGDNVKIRLKVADEQGRKNLNGILKNVTDASADVEIEGSKELYEIFFNHIAQANKVFMFPNKFEKKKRK